MTTEPTTPGPYTDDPGTDATDRDEHAALTEQLRAAGVRHALLTMTDQAGISRVKLLPVDRVATAALRGVSFSLTSALMLCSDDHIAEVPGFPQAMGDVRLCTDPADLRIVDADTGLAWLPADQRRVSGEPFEVCQRTALADQVTRAAELGLELRMAFEVEFTVFEADGETLAHRGPGYGLPPLLAVERWAVDLLDRCATAGITVEQLHPEYGDGQLEIAVRPASPVRAADEYTLLRLLAARTARDHGLTVSFAPRSTVDGAGNGAHLHVSARQDGRNIFAAADTGEAMTSIGEQFVAGLVDGLPAAVALLAPSVNSYERLQPGHFSGAYSCWGVENREAAVRYIPGAPGRRDEGANCEIKTVDGAANPYLAAATVLAMGRAGITRSLTLPPGLDQPPGDGDDTPRLAADLRTALRLLADNTLLREEFGSAMIDSYLAIRAREWDAYAAMPAEERIRLLRFRY